jgi:hypothetical protein
LGTLEKCLNDQEVFLQLSPFPASSGFSDGFVCALTRFDQWRFVYARHRFFPGVHASDRRTWFAANLYFTRHG